ncbi:PIR Superfamily Protein [Plasmodium ovale wallikeri]|uniref:PIR Superfamily Protein n=1 Tax=Plasmodium ovale wallikeri TaxID=864142 RepID=A0A1A9AT92_PLAOA|nr:PIR Superfamily Protein [Plasmodium ovale wallikeri]
MSNLTEEKIYSYVSSFPEYKGKLDSITTQSDLTHIYNCNITDTDNIIGKGESLSNICLKAVQYLNDLKGKHEPHYITQGCSYLYYWIYYDVLGEKKSGSNTFKIYKILNDAYDSIDPDSHVCEASIENISDDILLKLKDLYDLHDNLKKFKEKSPPTEGNICTYAKKCVPIYKKHLNDCHSGINRNFCNELEIFRTEYNECIQKEISCINQVDELPSTKKYDIVVILIPFVIILIKSFILFLLYKFTSFGLWLSSRIRREKNVWNNLEEDIKFQNTLKIDDQNLRNSSYNMPYHSVEHS